ncbi:MAG: hypothetical protein DRG78_05925 [Epsilonproteobacteria bacterium]|nr:MAG: hypothetical protein DRG78_05925 [Campylobacterota bacterium]
MKLYVYKHNGTKRYLDINATSRQLLLDKIGNTNFILNDEDFHINDVIAEKDDDSTPLSMVVGGALGLAGGVVGVIAGGIIGGLLGNSSTESEQIKVESFNMSSL